MADFKKAIEKVLKYEGGYANDLADRGGETNYGITIAVARGNGYQGEMRELPISKAKEIYERNYWRYNKLDLVESQLVAEYLFDIAVNCGNATMAKMIQKVINLLTGTELLLVDGIVGRFTVEGLNKLTISHGQELMNCLRGERYCLYRDIVLKNRTQWKFLHGWLLRV